MPARRVIRVAREHLLAAVSRSRFSAVLVILLCLIAAGWTIANVRHVYERAHLEPTVPAGIVYDWESYASVGHRIGPPDAATVLVVFMDYQSAHVGDSPLDWLHCRRNTHPLSPQSFATSP